MKRGLIAVLVLAALGYVRAQVPVNVELIESQPIVGGDNYAPRGVVRLHDRASGVEILCFRDSSSEFKASISCVLTGRKW